MNKLNCHCTFTYSRSYPVHCSGSHITCRKYSGNASFKRVRITVKLPDFFKISDLSKSLPVSMNPFESLKIFSLIQSVTGRAPMKINKAPASLVFCSPVSLFFMVTDSSLLFPITSAYHRISY